MKHFKYDAKVILVILAIRKLRKYKQLHLALELGMDRSSYTRLEQGKALLSPGRFDKIAETLQTSTYVILTIAKAIENIDFEQTSTEDHLTSFFNEYPNHVSELGFTPQQFICIFITIKRFHSKVLSQHLSYF